MQLGIHTYFNNPTGGGDGLSECVPSSSAFAVNRIPELTNLAKQRNIKIAVTEIGVINSNNCLDVLKNTLKHFTDHGDVYELYTWWTATPDLSYWGNSAGAGLLLKGETDPRYVVMKNSMSSKTLESTQQYFFANHTFNTANTGNLTLAIDNQQNTTGNNRLASSALTLLSTPLAGIAIGIALLLLIVGAYYGGKKLHSKFFQNTQKNDDIETTSTNVPKQNF